MTQALANKKEKKWGNKLLRVFRKAKGFDRNSEEIPPIVREPILWLKERNALGEEGIFRIPGSATKIKELKLRYDKGKRVDLSQINNVHTVAGLLKVFFRELPEPLLTFELYDAWIEAIKPDDLRTKLERIRKVVFTLPTGNRIILDTLLSFLKEVSLHTSNCMNIKNLAIVFAPSLIRPKVEKIEEILINSTYVNSLVVLLIQYYNFIFLGKPLDENEVPQEISNKPNLISLEKARSIHGSEGGNDNVIKDSKPKKSEKRSKDQKKSKKVMMIDEPKERPNDKLEDNFLKTLKHGTIKLANSLLEEQSILCELQDIDSLSPNEIEMLERKLITKVKETKVLKSKARKARIVQRSISSNFNRLRELNEQKLLNNGNEVENNIPIDIQDIEKVSITQELNISNENVEVNNNGDENQGVVQIDELDVFEDLNDEYFKFEDELDGILNSDDEEEDLPKVDEDLSLTVQEDEETNISKSFDMSPDISSIVDAVLDGNMGIFHNYLGEFKTMGRIDRSKSKRQLMSKINFVEKEENDSLL